MNTSKYTIAALALMMNFSLFGQFNLGVKGGLNFSDAKTELYIDAVNEAPQAYTSFVVGLVSEIEINRYLSFQPELQYARKGFTINQGTSFNALGIDIPIGAKATTSINYVETPLLAKVKVGEGNIRAYGLAGPSIGRATSARIQPKVTLLIDWNLPSIDINLDDNMYNRTEVSGIVGGGIEFETGQGKLFSDMRYQHSFSNIINNPIADVSVKNSGIQLSAGYSYRF